MRGTRLRRYRQTREMDVTYSERVIYNKKSTSLNYVVSISLSKYNVQIHASSIIEALNWIVIIKRWQVQIIIPE